LTNFQEYQSVPYIPSAGGITENYVAFTHDDGHFGFYDLASSWRLCVPCTLRTGAIFRLRGSCKDSLLGRSNLLATSVKTSNTCNILDSKYVVVNGQKHLEYSGLFVSNIWCVSLKYV
jgi:hypothetical protein